MSKLTKKQIELITEYIKKGEGSDDDLYDFLTENKIPVKAANRYIYETFVCAKECKGCAFVGLYASMYPCTCCSRVPRHFEDMYQEAK